MQWVHWGTDFSEFMSAEEADLGRWLFLVYFLFYFRFFISAEEEDLGDSIMRLDAMRRIEKESRMARLRELVATNNNGVGAFYKAVASMSVEGMPAEEIEEFRGRLAHRMLNEFEHEGYDKKVMKTQKTLRRVLKRSQNLNFI